MDNLPIDIHSSKLLDWLLSRRHCNADWQKEAYVIREKINSAIQDMPEHEQIVNLLSGTYINYFHCGQIVNILKETEADSKNIFGYYSSQRMKDWQEVLRLYQKDGVYLAESAQMLQRLVQYEIPAMKKQILKSQTTRQECEKKEEDYRKLSKEAAKSYQQECVKMGINGEKIRSELLGLAANLDTFFDGFLKNLEQLRKVRTYYGGFRKYLLRSDSVEYNLLPILKFVLENGNKTFYEWKHGKVPERIEGLDLESNQNENLTDEIDFGDEELAIDFGSDANIDFGQIEMVQSSDDVIDFDIVEQVTSDGVARGEEALGVLEHPVTQKLLLQDLLELESFLKCRIVDVSREHPADFLLASQRARDFSSSHVTAVDQSELESYIRSVQQIHTQLTDPYKKHLYKIRGSAPYLTKLTEQLETQKYQSSKYLRMAELMNERQNETVQEASDLAPKLDLMVKRTRQLQKEMESEISKKYKERPVNIMGGITAALA